MAALVCTGVLLAHEGFLGVCAGFLVCTRGVRSSAEPLLHVHTYVMFWYVPFGRRLVRKMASVKSTPETSLTSSIVGEKAVPSAMAPVRIVPSRLAPSSDAAEMSAPVKSAPRRSHETWGHSPAKLDLKKRAPRSCAFAKFVP